MNPTITVNMATIADCAFRLAHEINAGSARDHQRFAAQDLKEAINEAAAIINGLCEGPGPTVEERKAAKKMKEIHRATAIAIPRGPARIPSSQSSTKGKRQDVRPVGNRTAR